jgi:hypothetical protein
MRLAGLEVNSLVARLIRVRAGPIHLRHDGSCPRVTAALFPVLAA